jgi:hypothetical protein
MHACRYRCKVTAPERGDAFHLVVAGRFRLAQGQRQMNDVTPLARSHVRAAQHLFQQLTRAPDRDGFCICTAGGELEFRIQLE